MASRCGVVRIVQEVCNSCRDLVRRRLCAQAYAGAVLKSSHRVALLVAAHRYAHQRDTGRESFDHRAVAGVSDDDRCLGEYPAVRRRLNDVDIGWRPDFVRIYRRAGGHEPLDG